MFKKIIQNNKMLSNQLRTIKEAAIKENWPKLKYLRVMLRFYNLILKSMFKKHFERLLWLLVPWKMIRIRYKRIMNKEHKSHIEYSGYIIDPKLLDTRITEKYREFYNKEDVSRQEASEKNMTYDDVLKLKGI